MRRALGGDHLRLAIHDLGTGDRRDGMGHLTTALRTSPETVAVMAARAVRRRLRGDPPDLARIPR